MSLVPLGSQLSSSFAVRLEKLQKLHQVLIKGKSHKDISKAITRLHKIDLKAIREKITIKDIGSKTPKKKEKLITLVKGQLKKLSHVKTDNVFHASVKQSKNLLSKIPVEVMSTIVWPFLTLREGARFRATCRDAAKIESASHTITHYQLAPLIETYLHRSCTDLTESGKTKALNILMSFANKLSTAEKIPCPNHYRFLVKFFKLVEGRNLIRMMEGINGKLLGIPLRPRGVKNFKVPEDVRWTLLKAKRLRTWMERHKHLLSTIHELRLGNAFLKKGLLTLLPKEIGILEELRILDLSYNGIISLPKEIGQLRALQVLDLRYNSLSILPKEIGQLHALQKLLLDNNNIANLPGEIGQLGALQNLDLPENGLTHLPKGIGRLKSLQNLCLNDNKLAELPREIGRLQKLKFLDLHYNNFISFPRTIANELSKLEALQHIWFDHHVTVKEMDWLPIGGSKSKMSIYIARTPERLAHGLRLQHSPLRLNHLLQTLFSICVKAKQDISQIEDLLDIIEKLHGKETRSQLHRCLYEEAKKVAKNDKTLRHKLKDKQFARKAFLDPRIDPKLKAAAIESFRKHLEQQGPARK